MDRDPVPKNSAEKMTKMHWATIPAKQRVVVETLRLQITRGKMAPGDRLPTRDKLRRTFDASTDTVQRSMDRLLRDGFIESKGTLGTFVVQSPPHLCHYGLVIPNRPTPGRLWSRFYIAMQQAVNSLQGSNDRNVSFYYGEEHRPHGKVQDDLSRDVLSRRLAGLIFADNPFQLIGSPALDPENEIPKVAIMAAHKPEYDRIPAVYPSHRSFLDRSLDYIKSKGRKRVGFLSMFTGTELHGYIASALKKRGLITQPYWNLNFHPNLTQSSRNSTHLLMRWDRKEIPDALIVSDDNLIEPVVAGLIDAGIKVPTDVDIVGYGNFPSIAQSVLPVKRLGCDCTELIRRCIELLDLQRQGNAVPPMTWLDARFEEEIGTEEPVAKKLAVAGAETAHRAGVL